MSKNLGNIPNQVSMTEEQEQTFTNGINKGRKLERERILAMKKEIINCVIDYGLTPEKYERICNDIDALIKGENK